MRLDELNKEILAGLSGQQRRDFERGLELFNMANPDDREALRGSIKHYHPEYSPEQVETFVTGEAKEDKADPLTASFVRLGLDRKQAQIAGDVKGMGNTMPSTGDRDALIASLKFAHPSWTDKQINDFITG